MENPNSHLTAEDIYTPSFWSLFLAHNLVHQNDLAFKVSLENFDAHTFKYLGYERDEEKPDIELRVDSLKVDTDVVLREGIYFVSEKFRNMMDLPDTDAQYLDVRTTGSNTRMIDKNFKIMFLLGKADVVDFERSQHLTIKNPLDSSDIHSPFKTRFKPDARPTHQVFTDDLYHACVCSREVALRVINSDCKGVAIYHPGFPNGSRAIRLTQKGIGRMTDKKDRKNGDYMYETLIPFKDIDWNC